MSARGYALHSVWPQLSFFFINQTNWWLSGETNLCNKTSKPSHSDRTAAILYTSSLSTSSSVAEKENYHWSHKVVIRTNSHWELEDNLPSGQVLIRTNFHQDKFTPGKIFTRTSSHQDELSSGQVLIRMSFNQDISSSIQVLMRESSREDNFVSVQVLMRTSS